MLVRRGVGGCLREGAVLDESAHVSLRTAHPAQDSMQTILLQRLVPAAPASPVPGPVGADADARASQQRSADVKTCPSGPVSSVFFDHLRAPRYFFRWFSFVRILHSDFLAKKRLPRAHWRSCPCRHAFNDRSICAGSSCRVCSFHQFGGCSRSICQQLVLVRLTLRPLSRQGAGTPSCSGLKGEHEQHTAQDAFTHSQIFWRVWLKS